MSITGECFCSDIKYKINGTLHDARSYHCSRCRKAFSTQASAYALVKEGEFEWLSGEDKLTSYVGDPEISLSRHIYVGSKATWELIADGVPQYEEAPLSGT